MSASDVQIGGDHYKNMAIQPLEFIMANRLPFPEGAIIKYVCRWRLKGGIEDLQKARHLLDWLIEYRDRKAQAGPRPPERDVTAKEEPAEPSKPSTPAVAGTWFALRYVDSGELMLSSYGFTYVWDSDIAAMNWFDNHGDKRYAVKLVRLVWPETGPAKA